MSPGSSTLLTPLSYLFTKSVTKKPIDWPGIDWRLSRSRVARTVWTRKPNTDLPKMFHKTVQSGPSGSMIFLAHTQS